MAEHWSAPLTSVVRETASTYYGEKFRKTGIDSIKRMSKMEDVSALQPLIQDPFIKLLIDENKNIFCQWDARARAITCKFCEISYGDQNQPKKMIETNVRDYFLNQQCKASVHIFIHKDENGLPMPALAEENRINCKIDRMKVLMPYIVRAVREHSKTAAKEYERLAPERKRTQVGYKGEYE